MPESVSPVARSRARTPARAPGREETTSARSKTVANPGQVRRHVPTSGTSKGLHEACERIDLGRCQQGCEARHGGSAEADGIAHERLVARSTVGRQRRRRATGPTWAVAGGAVDGEERGAVGCGRGCGGEGRRAAAPTSASERACAMRRPRPARSAPPTTDTYASQAAIARRVTQRAVAFPKGSAPPKGPLEARARSRAITALLRRL